MPVTIVVSSVNCEGRCGCRCEACKGVGYWEMYKVDIPQPVFTAISPPCTRWDQKFPKSFYVSLIRNGANPNNTYYFSFCDGNYGSEGGIGCCKWFVFYNVGSDGDTIGWYPIGSITVEMRHDQLVLTLIVASNAYYRYVFNISGSFDCRTGGSFYIEHTEHVGFSETACEFDFTGLPVVVTPFSSSNWFQCGQNTDGTDFEAESMSQVVATGSARRTRVRQPLPLAHPDRCDFLGVRTEKLPGCNGWLCKHDCLEGLPAVPGGYCQSCKKYDADPDYKGKGIAGWLA